MEPGDKAHDAHLQTQLTEQNKHRHHADGEQINAKVLGCHQTRKQDIHE